MAAITICSDFGAPQNKVCHCFHCFRMYSSWRDGTRCHDAGVSGGGMGRWWHAAGSGALSVAVRCTRPSEVGHHYLYHFDHSFVSGQTTGGDTALPINKNCIKDLLSTTPPIRTRPSFPHSQSLPSGSFHKTLILFL